MKSRGIAIVLAFLSTGAYANVIFPAFVGPYISIAMFPLAGAAILLSESVVYKVACRQLSIPTVLLLVVVANVVSSIIGIGVAFFLPDGLVYGTTGVVVGGPNFSLYFNLSFVLAYLISILIEGAILKFASSWFAISRPFLVSIAANTVSYLFLVSIVWLGL